MGIDYLIQVAKGQVIEKSLSRELAIQKLGVANQKDSVQALIELLEDTKVAEKACAQLAQTVYIFDAYYQVVHQYRSGNPWATQLLRRWTQRAWLSKKPALPESISAVVFRMPGCITAEMLSPIREAFSRSNISLHAQSLLKDIMPEAISQLQRLKLSGYSIAFVADQIDTSKASLSQRQSALQALLWHIGESSEDRPNQKRRGIVLSGQMDQGFHELGESCGVLLLKLDTLCLNTGNLIHIKPYQEIVLLENKGCLPFKQKQPHWRSIWRMGGRTPFMLGSALTRKAQTCLASVSSSRIQTIQAVAKPAFPEAASYTRAQKIIGSACGVEGLQPKTFCEPIVSTVAVSHLTMHRHQSLTEFAQRGYLAELVLKEAGFNADLYPGALALKSQDGRQHAWVNRLLLPDQVSFSEDPYTRYSLGVTLSPGVAETCWAGLAGLISMVMPESVLVRFHGSKRSDIRLRDLINAIPYFGLSKGLFRNSGVNNTLGRIVEIQGLDFLTVAEAYELTEDSLSYQSFACTLELAENKVIETLAQNKKWLEQLINLKYPDHGPLQHRLDNITHWLENPRLLRADSKARYTKVLEINLADVTEPLLGSIENLNLVVPLSEAAKPQTIVDTVWIGSTAIHLDHYRIVAKLLQKHRRELKAQLWVAPPSTIELKQLMREGCYQVYGRSGVYTQMPEHVLCTEAHFEPSSKVVATSGRALLKSIKQKWSGYIVSPELATMTAILGRLPTLYEYQSLLAD